MICISVASRLDPTVDALGHGSLVSVPGKAISAVRGEQARIAQKNQGRFRLLSSTILGERLAIRAR
jgi:hypothetical protein